MNIHDQSHLENPPSTSKLDAGDDAIEQYETGWKTGMLKKNVPNIKNKMK